MTTLECDCVAKIRTALKKQYGPDVSLDTCMVMSGGGLREEFQVEFKYLKGRRRVRAGLEFTFCPFCGVKRKEKP